MNEINLLSILKDDSYTYASHERSRCFICAYDSTIPHDISQITDHAFGMGNIFISDYNTARCKDVWIIISKLL